MDGLQATLVMIDLLEELRVAYMLVGSFSSNFYGIPRQTQDADFVVEVHTDTITRIADRFRPPLRMERQLSFETITMTVRNIVHVDGSAFKIELFHLNDGDFAQARFAPHDIALYGAASLVPHGRGRYCPKAALAGIRQSRVGPWRLARHRACAARTNRLALRLLMGRQARHPPTARRPSGQSARILIPPHLAVVAYN